jgi:hypothetical protein
MCASQLFPDQLLPVIVIVNPDILAIISDPFRTVFHRILAIFEN